MWEPLYAMGLGWDMVISITGTFRSMAQVMSGSSKRPLSPWGLTTVEGKNARLIIFTTLCQRAEGMLTLESCVVHALNTGKLY